MTGLPPLIPRTVLFGNPEKAEAQLSPSGDHLAYLAPLEGVLNVWVSDVSGRDARPVTRDTDRGIRTFLWAKDRRHVLYLQDVGGDENWRLYGVDLEGGGERCFTPLDNVQVQLVAHEKRHPRELLLAINRDDPRLHDVYHLDLRTGELTVVEKNPGDVVSWIADADLFVRGALAAREDGGFDLRVRQSGESQWSTLVSWSAEDALNSGPIGFTADGGSLYLLDSRDANAARLVKLDIRTGTLDVLAADPQYDAGPVVRHPDTREVQMVAFLRARQEWQILDPSIREDVALISRLRDADFAISSRTDDDRQWVVAFTEDDAPASYYRFERITKSAHFLFFTRPRLAEYTLASMEPISYRARDGLTIHGYLTLPPGLPPRNLPLVLNVHGGPWHRDTWGYDPEAQWLANRGYACLQVNFRGSTGYGKAFLNAGDREWGGKMHDDLVDGVNWAVDRGIADPARVAIFGGSYGGYAALVGATFTPELFRCAVSVVGPSNLVTFIKSIPPYWSSYLAMLHRRVGNPDTEADFLLSRSPLTFVDRIRIPILIAQGANDPRVKRSESEQIVAAMREKGIEHEYLLFEDEGHGFAKPENRLRFYAAAERFLARHLGGRAEP
jgi:dipeptidyl aminopeptidase/acylaminoacyl peptidase